MSNNYVVYHLHSDISSAVTNIDSINKPEHYVSYAKSLNMTALGFSEHANVLNWKHKKDLIEDAGMKYIHACEFYLTEDDIQENVHRDNYHCVLIAKNYEGVKEINLLSSQSFNRDDWHFYYVPRISVRDLYNTSDNIIITSACLAGVFNKGNKDLQKEMLKFFIANKNRCYLEIQHHNCKEQVEYNKKLYTISKKTGVPLIAGTDTHALNQEYAEGRRVLQKAKGILFEDEESWDLIFKTYDELLDAYKLQNALPKDVYMEAVENTNNMANQIESFELDYTPKYPKLYNDSEKVFQQKIIEGLKDKNINDSLPNYNEYLNQIKYEYKTYKHNDAINFMLLEEKYKKAMREQGIQYGYSRGSCSGSIIAYLLHITDVDSIKHKLNFQRFMNTERVSLADIDTDWYSKDREKVKKYLYSLHGLYCCDIVTFNTVQLKGAIREIGRALDIPLEEVNTICDNLETSEDELRLQYPKLFYYADLVTDVIVSVGFHPAGLVVSPFPIEDYFGTFTTSTNEYPIAQWNMKEIDSLNFVKLDILSLDNIGLINETCKLAGIKRLTPQSVPDDINVWNSIRDDTTLIFQFESAFASDYIKGLFSDETINKIKKYNPNFSYIDLMSVANGALRPAGESYREALKHGDVKDNGHEALNKMLASTNGFLVYQEQVIQFLHEFCGFTMGEADIVRRCLSEDTNILMSDGSTKKIKDVNIGDTVLSIDDNGVAKTDIVNHVFDNGVQDVYEIKLPYYYSIKGTKSHRVLTQDGWKTIGELTTDDWLFTPSNIICSTDGLPSNKRLSNDEMFLVGLLIGDGTLGSDVVSFTNSDIELINAYKQCVQSRTKGNVEFIETHQEGKTVDKIYNIKIKSGVYRRSLDNLIKKLGLRVKSANKHIPVEFMGYPNNNKIQSLLGGLFSTDGGYNTNAKCIEYYSKSKKLCVDIKHLLLKFGIYSYVLEKNVSGYDYKTYSVYIGQIDSLKNFEKYILPYVKGYKRDKYVKLLEESFSNNNSYNYSLPNKCGEEIRTQSEKMGISFNSLSNGNRVTASTALTDKKAERYIRNIYAPYTYEILRKPLIPIKIKSIEYIGKSHVYDLEVNNNHNYIANDLIVHNCFAKKTGTEEQLPKIHNGFIKTMTEKYGTSKDEAEKIVTDFLKVIEDASNYLFSLNHALPYSYIGYICGYLRYYYPLEFLTSALNIFENKADDTARIVAYANKVGIQIKGIKFGKSESGYTLDKENNCIYKGIASIKYCNSEMASCLLKLSENHYDNFIDLLRDIKEQHIIDSRQLNILIGLNFFSDFGNNKYLMDIVNIYEKFGNCKVIKKANLESLSQEYGIGEYLIVKYSNKETAKQYSDIDNDGLVKEVCKQIPNKSLSVKEQIQFENDALGYIEYVNDKLNDFYWIVTEFKTYKNKDKPYFTVRNLKNGKTVKTKIKDSKIFKQNPFEQYSVLVFKDFSQVNKMKKINDKWIKTEELEPILEFYDVITKDVIK